MSHTLSYHNGYEIRAYRCDVCHGTERVVPDEDVYATPPLFALLTLDVCRDCIEGGKAEAYVNDFWGGAVTEPRTSCAFCSTTHAGSCAAGREEDARVRRELEDTRDYGRVL